MNDDKEAVVALTADQIAKLEAAENDIAAIPARMSMTEFRGSKVPGKLFVPRSRRGKKVQRNRGEGLAAMMARMKT